MNVYEFKRILSGPNQGFYCHPFFRRSDISNVCKIVRKKQKSELCVVPLIGSQGASTDAEESFSFVPSLMAAPYVDRGNHLTKSQSPAERQSGVLHHSAAADHDASSIMLPDISLYNHAAGLFLPSVSFFAAVNSFARHAQTLCKQEEVVCQSPLQHHASHDRKAEASQMIDPQGMFGSVTSLDDAITRISSTLVCNHDNVDRRSLLLSSLPVTTTTITSKFIDGFVVDKGKKAACKIQDMPVRNNQHENILTGQGSFPDMLPGTECNVVEANLLTDTPKRSPAMKDMEGDDDESIATIDDISGLLMQMESENCEPHHVP